MAVAAVDAALVALLGRMAGMVVEQRNKDNQVFNSMIRRC